MRVVGVEGGPSAVLALQTGNPLAPAADRGAVVLPIAGKIGCPIERHDYNGRIVEIGIVRIGVLERPAPRPDVWTLGSPIPLRIKHLPWLQPFEPLDGAF